MSEGFSKLFYSMFLLNILFAILNPSFFANLFGSIVGTVITILTVTILAGLNLLSSGLSSTSIKYLLSVMLVLGIFFRFNYGIEKLGINISIGIGLLNNVNELLSEVPVIGFPIALLISVLTVVSGIFFFARTT